MLKDFYINGSYVNKNPDWHLTSASWKADAVYRMISRHHLRPDSICEIGCGTGEILRILQNELETQCALTGYDIAPHAIEIARKRGENERLHFHCKDFMQESGDGFDLIMLIDTLEHFENCFQVLRDLKDRSTYKLLLLPLDISASSVILNELIDYRHATGHLHFFTKDVALEVLRDSGYEVLDHFYYLRPFDAHVWGEDIRHRPLELPIGILKLLRRVWYRIPRHLLYAINPDFAVRLLGGWKLVVLLR